MDIPTIAGASAPPVVAPVAPDAASTAAPEVQGAAPVAGKAAPAQPNPAQLSGAVKAINRSMLTQSRGLEFSVDASSHRTIVKVVDSQTKEVIRQIPSAETLEIAASLGQAQGLLIKSQA